MEKSVCFATKRMIVDFIDGLREPLEEWMWAVVIAVNVKRRGNSNAGLPLHDKVMSQQFMRR